jgi:hypothetical protein
LKTFLEKLRPFQQLGGFLNTFFVELRLFSLCLCGLNKTFCRGGFLASVSSWCGMLGIGISDFTEKSHKPDFMPILFWALVKKVFYAILVFFCFRILGNFGNIQEFLRNVWFFGSF